MSIQTFIVFFIIVTAHCLVVIARPDGSPVCTVGSAAPQSLHLSRKPGFLGGISAGNFEVKIGDAILSSNDANEIPAGTNLALDVRSTDGSEFRGILIILNKDGIDLSSNFNITSTGFKEQIACSISGYAGFTHTSRDLKKVAQGLVILPANQEVFLDVNIVVANNFVKGSIFYHTRYQLFTDNVSSAPVRTPVRVPAKAPVRAPVKVPVRAPVKAPAQVPHKSPVRAPATAPVRAPAKVPVVAPVKAPAQVPNKSPVRVPATAPVRAPVKAPAQVPNKSPVRIPAKAPVRAPVKAPAQVPNKSPVRAPAKAPVRAPAKAPVRATVKAPAQVPNKSPVRTPVRTPLCSLNK